MALLAAVAALPLTVSACGTAESRGRAALEEYQAAAAAGDLQAARLALVKAVSADDSVADYWVELGRVQLQLGSYGDAYYAFTRAHELERTNVAVLGMLTQLALYSDNLDMAEDLARRLELIAPSHPSVDLTYGYVELRRSNFEEAMQRVDKVLAATPFDSGAKILKARILLATDKRDEAVALLNGQVLAQPNDTGALRALIAIHSREENWAGVADAARQMAEINPKDIDSTFLFIEASFREGRVDQARAASLRLLAPDAPGDQVGRVLSLWNDYWRTAEAVAEARRLAAAAPNHLLAYAGYFNQAGEPDDAAALLGNTPQLPVTRANSSLNAILAESLFLRGRIDEARQLLNSVLTIEPDHVYALRARVDLQTRHGPVRRAIRDAQRLITVEPDSTEDRLRLAKAYAAAGDQRQLDRALWDAFHQIPADRKLYETLRAHVAKSRGMDAAQRVTEEYQDQLDKGLSRGLV